MSSALPRLMQLLRAPGNAPECLPALCAQLIHAGAPPGLISVHLSSLTMGLSPQDFYFLGEGSQFVPIHVIFLCAAASYTECLSVGMPELGDCKPLPVPAAEVLKEKDV